MCQHVIIDLEMCKVPRSMRKGSYHYSSETIQIGAVLVNEQLEIMDEFCTFVHPQYGTIDRFISNLTGITSDDVKGACEMEEALSKLTEWIPEDAECISWSTSDQKQILHEMEAKDINNPKIQALLECWKDCQKTFSEKIGVHRRYNLKEALNLADINYDENVHDGLVDAMNTAVLFIKMEKEEELSLSKYFIREEEEAEPVTCVIGDLFPELKAALA